LQVADPASPSAGVRGSTEEAQIEGIDDPPERFARMQDVVD
jgi:hypothetical protein